MEEEKIMVVGAGLMGSGIAQVMATAGYDVVVRDLDDAFVNKGMAAIEKNLQGSVVKGKLSDAEKAAIIGRITPTTKLDPAKECQLVIEVVIERKQEKMYHFSE